MTDRLSMERLRALLERADALRDDVPERLTMKKNGELLPTNATRLRAFIGELADALREYADPPLVRTPREADRPYWKCGGCGRRFYNGEPICGWCTTTASPMASEEDKLDGDEVRSTLREWARQIRAAESQEELLMIAQDMEVNAGEAALSSPREATDE